MDEAALRRVESYHVGRRYRRTAWKIAGGILLCIYAVLIVAINVLALLSTLGSGGSWVLPILYAGSLVPTIYTASRTPVYVQRWWAERVELGERLAELDAPIPDRPWVPSTFAAVVGAAGAVIAAVVASKVR